MTFEQKCKLARRVDRFGMYAGGITFAIVIVVAAVFGVIQAYHELRTNPKGFLATVVALAIVGLVMFVAGKIDAFINKYRNQDCDEDVQ